MITAIRYADARSTLGLSLDDCVANLLAGKIQPGTEQFDDQLDPVQMPYFSLPIKQPLRPAPADIIYPYLHSMTLNALDSAGLTTAERKRTGLFLGSSSFDVCVSELQYQVALRGPNPALAVPMPIIGYGKLAYDLGQQLAISVHRYTYSTACTSSANALLYAHRMLLAGVIDHALVVGMEFFNQTTLLGFYGLGLISPSQTMRPFSCGRDGLILGEGCGVLLLSRDTQASPIQLCGGAIATDNHSLTAANIDGSSLAAVIEQALANSDVDAKSIAAVKVHGTASLMNDEAEAAGLRRVFGEQLPPTFALKPFCGHTLGASGALEMALTIGCMQKGLLPANPQFESDPELGVSLISDVSPAPTGHYLMNCFAFGGNNNALIVRRESV